MSDQKNTIIAVILSVIVLIAWQYFFLAPKQRQEQLQRQQQAQSQQMPAAPSTPGNVTAPQGEASQGAGAQPPPEPSGTLTPTELKDREAVISSTLRIPINSPRIKGSIALKGARIDDVSLSQYHETVDRNSPPIVLLSPSGSPFPYYAEFGWVAAGGSKVKLPGADTVWRQEGTGALAPGHPVTLSWDNGEGLVFHRTFSIDENYLFTLKDEVTNNSSTAVSLYPYGLISRHGAPKTVSFYFVHEGLIGEFGDQGEKQFSYKDIDKDVTKNTSETFTAPNSWLGITDQYWAAVLIPNKDDRVTSRFFGRGGRRDEHLPGRLPARCADDCAGRDRQRGRASLRRRQGAATRRRVLAQARPQQIRPADRLGVVLVLHASRCSGCSTCSSSTGTSASPSCS